MWVCLCRKHVCSAERMSVSVSYLAQMMPMAINETMHTPPTKEPAIRESCCPSSDLYSSANTCKYVHMRTRTHTDTGIIFISSNRLTYTQLGQLHNFWRGKYKPDSSFLSVSHKISFARHICHDSKRTKNPGAHSHTHEHTQSRAEFNYFTARFSLLLTLSVFLSQSCALFPLQHKTSTHPHTPANHTPTYRQSVFGRACPCCRLRSRPLCGPSPAPHSQSPASDLQEQHWVFCSAQLSCSVTSGTERKKKSSE